MKTLYRKRSMEGLEKFFKERLVDQSTFSLDSIGPSIFVLCTHNHYQNLKILKIKMFYSFGCS